jgi:hypothetical protein
MRTNDLLATGGVLQEGGTKDPVSGNDVPAGALKEEVRDDVPAQLSPGEFVFPADVTRYIGLDKLMQIREAAKEGLKEMDSKGQMGNAEEVADNGEGEDKFSSHIDEIISGLDSGSSETKKFAEGGLAADDTSYKDAPIKGFKMVAYEDTKTGAVRYIPYINGKPLLTIPQGYTVRVQAPTTVTPPATTPTEVTTTTPTTGGGGGNAGGKSTETEGGGNTLVKERDTGVEGFGDIGGGTSPNVARVIGAGLGLINPVLGLVVSAAGQYATKENNKKVAAANVKAVDASALSAMGFSAQQIKSAQDAVATATLAGKSAKEIAVAAANAASLNDTTKTSLDALIGVTNGWNTATKENPITKMPESLVNKIPEGLWGEVTQSINDGMSPEQAVQKAIDTVADPVVASYFSVDAKIAEAGLEGQIPAGEYTNVSNYINAGLTPAEAIAQVERRLENEKAAAAIEADRAAKAAADQEAADRAAKDAEQAAREAANQKALDAARAAADKEAADRAAQQAAQDAADRAARQQEAADKAARDKEASDREAANQKSLEAAKAEADRVERGGGGNAGGGGYSGAPSGGSDVGRSPPGSAHDGQGGYGGGDSGD